MRQPAVGLRCYLITSNCMYVFTQTYLGGPQIEMAISGFGGRARVCRINDQDRSRRDDALVSCINDMDIEFLMSSLGSSTASCSID